MAAPTNAAKREESPCQPGAVHTWHETDMPRAIIDVCYRGVKQTSRLRPPTSEFAIALANKIARMAWAMMARGERYKEPVALAR